MKIEYITRICLTSRWTLQKQRQRTICHCMLWQIIIDNQHIFALIHKILCKAGSRIWRDILQRCRVARRCAYNNGVLHRSVFCQCIYNFSNRRRLLPDCHIYTDNVFALLINHRVGRYGCLSCLSVPDNQLSLSAPNRKHGVNRQNPCFQRLINRFSVYNARRIIFNRTILICLYCTLSVNRCA